ASHGHSMEEEAHNILRAALSAPAATGTGAALAHAIRARAQCNGGIDLELPARDAMREPPDLADPDTTHDRDRIAPGVSDSSRTRSEHRPAGAPSAAKGGHRLDGHPGRGGSDDRG